MLTIGQKLRASLIFTIEDCVHAGVDLMAFDFVLPLLAKLQTEHVDRTVMLQAVHVEYEIATLVTHHRSSFGHIRFARAKQTAMDPTSTSHTASDHLAETRLAWISQRYGEADIMKSLPIMEARLAPLLQ